VQRVGARTRCHGRRRRLPPRAEAFLPDSAAGLAAALAQLAHDRAEVDVAAQVLVYPMLDDRSGRGPDPDPDERKPADVEQRATGLVGAPTSAPPTHPTPHQPAEKISMACRRRGSG
jgi:acetyl esterase/lipase